MTLIEKRAERAKLELKNGLKELVALYIVYRRNGNVGLAKTVKGKIEHCIQANDLDRETVYFCYGDPDNPAERVEVYKRAEKVTKEI